jgi:hypothetical protein
MAELKNDGAPCRNPAIRGYYCGVHDPQKRAERRRKRGPTKAERELAVTTALRAASNVLATEARSACTVCAHPRLAEAVIAYERAVARAAALGGV